jgi:peptide/nickel transport system substrate-binding protein
MQYSDKLRAKGSLLVGLAFALLFLAAVACGSSAPATTVPEAPPVATQPAGMAEQPTAAPAATTPPEVMATEVNPGKLNIMIGGLGNERFDYVFSSGAGTSVYGRIMHGFLISDNEQKEMVPGIASQWDTSADGLTWTLTIREGVKFHDGSEVTPDDVLWSLQHAIGPGADDNHVSGALGSYARKMERIELSGPNEVSLTTKFPVAELGSYVLSETSVTWFNHIIPKRDKLWDEAARAAYDQNPIGSGFMSLVNHVPAAQMTFERFEDFYYQPANGFEVDRRVNFQMLDVFAVPEEATRVAAIRSGEADIAPASMAAKKQVEAGGGRYVFGPEGVLLDVRLIGCWGRPEDPHPCDDKRVRHALEYALDKEIFRDRLFGGPEVFHLEGWTVVTPSTFGYVPGVDPFPYDPDKARQLLADAGYPGGEGYGKQIIVTYPGTSIPLLVESAQLAGEMWRKELGIDVEVRVGESAAWSQAWRAGELQGMVYWAQQETRRDARGYMNIRWGDPEYSTRIHEDPDIFRAVKENNSITDLVKAEESTTKLNLRLRDESHYLGLGYFDLPWAVAPRVKAWQPWPLSLWPSGLHTVVLE